MNKRKLLYTVWGVTIGSVGLLAHVYVGSALFTAAVVVAYTIISGGIVLGDRQ